VFGWLARLAARNRWLIVIAWTAAAAASVLLAPSLSEVGINDDSQFLPADTESTVARDILRDRFYVSPESPSSTIQIVFKHSPALTTGDRAYAQAVRDWLLSDAGPASVKSVTSIFDNPLLEKVLVSGDGAVMLMNVGLSTPSLDQSSTIAVGAIRGYIKSNTHSGEIYVTGQVTISKDLFDSINLTIERTTLVTIFLVTILLLIAYRSPVASLVPLIAIGWSFLIARGLVGFLAEAGLKVSSLADAYLVVIIFGIGTDYCLFIISRFREELALGRSGTMDFALRKIGPVITASAVTVIVAFLALWTSQFGMTKSVGVALALGVAVTLLASLTLVPALMTIFGRRLFWPARVVKPAPESSGWHRISRFIVRQPWVLIIGIFSVLAVPYAALPSMKRSADVIAQIPKEVEAAAGFRVVQDHFPPGELQPLYLIVQSISVLPSDIAFKRDITILAASISRLPGVSRVDYFASPATSLEALAAELGNIAERIRAGGFSDTDTAAYQEAAAVLESLAIRYPGITTSQPFNRLTGVAAAAGSLLIQIQTSPPAALPPLMAQLALVTGGMAQSFTDLSNEFKLQVSTAFTDWLYKTYFSFDKSYARLNIILSLDPSSEEAVAMVPALREGIIDATGGTSLSPTIYLGGESARYADTLAVTSGDFGRVAVLAVAAILVIIFIVLRSLVAPLYMVATVLFNFGATLGITSFLVQDVFKQGNLIYVLPLFIFIMLVAVGADYNIFLMSRIREEAAARPPKEAVAHAVANTGGVISTCGIILAGTFSVLILSPLQMMYQIGFAIALGIILDTFIIRALLVPAIAAAVGRANWWPGRIQDTGKSASNEQREVAL